MKKTKGKKKKQSTNLDTRNAALRKIKHANNVFPQFEGLFEQQEFGHFSFGISDVIGICNKNNIQ